MAEYVNPHTGVSILECGTNREDMNFQCIDISDPNVVNLRPHRRRRSPIMVEFADPFVTSVDIARAMEAGMNIVKFRMAVTSKSEKVHLLSKIDKAAERCAAKEGLVLTPVATNASLKTWVKKCGISNDDFLDISENSEVILTCDQAMIENCTPKSIYVDYAHISKDVPIGMEITFGQGKVMMRCIGKVNAKSIKCKVHKGGRIGNMETVYFRSLKHTTPYISNVDIKLLKFCSTYQVDMLTVFYPKDGRMIKNIRCLLAKAQIKPLIYSAICNQDGIDNLDSILKESDGIILCREYLPYVLESRHVFRIALIQKWVAGKCQQAGKPLFITGVFDYVIANGDISDAEIADVTNALMDGVTGFIFRGCHDINNTLFALMGLNEICCQVEPLTFDKKIFWRMLREAKIPLNAADAAILSCVTIANQTNARVVVIPTVSGRTARALLWLRPTCIVITVCTRPYVARLLFTYRNIVPLLYKEPSKKLWSLMEEARVQYAVEFAVAKQWLKYGDIYVSLQRSEESHLFCDVIRVWTVTSSKKTLVECHYGSEEEHKSHVPKEKPVEKKKRRSKKKKVEQKVEEELDQEEGQDDEDHKNQANVITEDIL